jgi:hypothetical protein
MATMATASTIDRLKLQERMKRAVTGRVLYNADPEEPRTFSYNGMKYIIPPDGTCQRIPFIEGVAEPGIVDDKHSRDGVVTYDGTLTIFDRYGVDQQKGVLFRKAMREGKRMERPFPDKLIAAGLDIVKHAMVKIGKSGVEFLVGDDTDAEIKRQAKERWIEHKRVQVDRILANYRNRTADFHSNPSNKGQYAPSMDKHEIAAQMWQDADKLGQVTAVKYVQCPVDTCGFRHEEQSVIDRHVLAAHPKMAESMTSPDPEPAPKKGRG